MKRIKKILWFFFIATLAYVYFIPALLAQKEKEWSEEGMGSILESLDPHTDEQGQSDSTHDEP